MIELYRLTLKGVDKLFYVLKMGDVRPMESPCDHKRTEMLARRDGVDYVRCLDCDEVYEAEDLEPVLVVEDEQ